MDLIRSIKKYFSKKEELRFFKQASTENVFTHIYQTNKWGNSESVSGEGSNLEMTASLRDNLPGLLADLRIDSMLDIPCGDFFWMKEVKLPFSTYLGADIVKPLIESNNKLYGNEFRRFIQLDLLRDQLPTVDAIFCRECLVHLSFKDIHQAISNIRKSGAKYLLTTSFPHHPRNKDVVTGKHRSLNFQVEPFCWPAPISELAENRAERRGGKSLCVWKISELP